VWVGYASLLSVFSNPPAKWGFFNTLFLNEYKSENKSAQLRYTEKKINRNEQEKQE